VVLDMNFKRLLRTILKGDTFDNLPPQNVNRIMNDFEAGIRKTFDGTDSRTYTISLPGVPDDPETGLQAGIMTISPCDKLPAPLSLQQQTNIIPEQSSTRLLIQS